MDLVVEKITQALLKCSVETHKNVVYQIQHNSPENKAELKTLLKQGDIEKPHTVVSVDFVCRPVKLSRKQRAMRKQIELDPTNDIEFTLDSDIIRTESPPTITIYNSPIYIYGRYIKRSRNMTQSPLVINGELKTPHSVSDFSMEFQRFFASDPVKFMACGREDIDVRCTGGRPFILEIPRPRRNLYNNAMDITLHNDVDIVDCCIVNKATKNYINSDASSKTYSAVIFSQNRISFESTYHLYQKTPLRVLHRRANITRERDVRVLETSEHLRHDGYYYHVSIRTSSGTYVKEWASGDFGRTIPNLNADLLALDVTGIDKEIDREFIIDDVKLNVKRRHE
ncbi:tRNA pseudouridine synthase 10 [Pancytospora epiphaga]|nr:tRNA pseudouridine synthase 10 [Pancytospora epiphaga]